MSHKADPLLKIPSSVIVGTSDAQILGPNDLRLGIVVSAPVWTTNPQQLTTTVQSAVSTVAAGTKATLTIPATGDWFLMGAFYHLIGGTPPTIALQFFDGLTATTIQQGTADFNQNGPIALPNGLSLRFQCTVGGAGSSADFYLAMGQTNPTNRVTLAFGQAAILDQGINLYPGQNPLVLWGEHFGQSIREDIHAISSLAGSVVNIMDIFCECHLPELNG